MYKFSLVGPEDFSYILEKLGPIDLNIDYKFSFFKMEKDGELVSLVLAYDLGDYYQVKHILTDELSLDEVDFLLKSIDFTLSDKDIYMPNSFTNYTVEDENGHVLRIKRGCGL